MKYILMWKREQIDESETKEDAEYLRTEYNMAYGGGVTIRKIKNE